MPGESPGLVSLRERVSEPDESRPYAPLELAGLRVGFRLPDERLRWAGSEWAASHSLVLLPRPALPECLVWLPDETQLSDVLSLAWLPAWFRSLVGWSPALTQVVSRVESRLLAAWSRVLPPALSQAVFRWQ